MTAWGPIRQRVRAAACLAAFLSAVHLACAQAPPPEAVPAPPAAISPITPAQPDLPPAPPDTAIPPSAAPYAPLPAEIADILAAPAVARDHWGVMVTALDGAPIYSLNENQLFQPASNAKLFTTAAALALLGPNQRFTTQVVASGNLDKHGVLHGDLLLVGGGDANFGSASLPYVEPSARPKSSTPITAAPRPPANIADIERLADQVVAKGLHEVQGNVVGDDRKFSWEGYPDTWETGDLLWGYGARVSALTIHDNEISITVSPGARTAHDARTAAAPFATITASPADPYYSILNHVYTVSPASFGGCDAHLLFERAPGSKTLTITGDIPPRAAPCTEHIAIDDPAQFAALALRSALERRGVRITGAATAQHWDPGRLPGTPEDRNRDDGSLNFFLAHPGAHTECAAQYVGGGPPEPPQTILATHTSAPLITDLTYTNKVSQNLHAEILLRNLDAKVNPCSGGDVPHSLNAVRQWLTHIGIAPGEFVFYDGSGLSLHDLVTPHAVAQLLSYAASDPKTGQPQPWFAVWKSSLPIGGVDGTLDDRFTQPPLKGHVFAKTGTHSEDRALSGYLDAASGRTVIFSIMVGNHLPSTSDDRDVMDRIVAAIQSAE